MFGSTAVQLINVKRLYSLGQHSLISFKSVKVRAQVVENLIKILIDLELRKENNKRKIFHKYLSQQLIKRQ